MKTTLVLVILFLGISAAGQTPAKKYPHPFAQTAISLNGTSEHPVSLDFKGGVDLEEKHVIADAFGFYNTVRKDAPGISPDSKGHKRGFNGDVFYRKGNWHYGVGAEFMQFQITEYAKQAAFLFGGVGKDFGGDARVRVMYLHAVNERTKYPDGHGCACTNGVQGLRFNLWVPNPRDNRHWFFTMDLTPVIFHTTVTDPNDKKTTARQEAEHSIDSDIKFGLMYRF